MGGEGGLDDDLEAEQETIQLLECSSEMVEILTDCGSAALKSQEILSEIFEKTNLKLSSLVC